MVLSAQGTVGMGSDEQYVWGDCGQVAQTLWTSASPPVNWGCWSWSHYSSRTRWEAARCPQNRGYLVRAMLVGQALLTQETWPHKC